LDFGENILVERWLFVVEKREKCGFHIGKERRGSLVKEKVLIVVNVSFGIVHLVVGSGDGDDEGFDIEEFLFGERSCATAGKADVRFCIDFSHFFLGEEIENVDIFLGETWLEMAIEFA
jgi:hypothetical protein